MPRLKREDRVLVISGDDKGKEGRVLAVFPKKNRVLIEGVNMIKRHTKPNQQNQTGGIIEKEAPIHVSNVRVI
ncbi:MAG: 50S ribosomal protein L24 [Candidatus Eisenbacteria bacterium]|uniref:Large ribosomal subunit protein uL24 n=1 Tax=Eiseniibacteriota bacterium TaxID=2212470 RepID=A0A7Y2H103_UNCEI|nr:50S ribosomal protein L24 [Candidatus Eisenbacteria bacterium]